MITELGLLDTDLEAHHDAFGIKTADHQRGVAYPAVFVIDGDGTITQKRIQANYRAREGARQLLEAATGTAGLPPQAAVQEVSSPHVRVRAYADSTAYVRWERNRLHVELQVDPGWHVYGRPIPEGYTPLLVEIEPQEGLEIGEPSYPPVRPFRVEGLEEDFNVAEGRLEVVVPFAFNVAPETGTRTLEVSVSWQACSESECLMPELKRLEIQLDEAPPG